MGHQILLIMLTVEVTVRETYGYIDCPAVTKCIEKEMLVGAMLSYGEIDSDEDNSNDDNEATRLVVSGICRRQDPIVSCMIDTGMTSKWPLLLRVTTTIPLQNITLQLKAMLKDICLHEEEVADLSICLQDKYVLTWSLKCMLQTASDLMSSVFDGDKLCRGKSVPFMDDFTTCVTGHMNGRCDEEDVSFMQMKSVQFQNMFCKNNIDDYTDGTLRYQGRKEEL